MRTLPPNINATYRGILPHNKVVQELSRHDLLFLPTLGENFGHVIVESLQAGCPVLIGEQTPWRNLEERGVGWDLPAKDFSAFREVLQHCIDMDNEEHRGMRSGAKDGRNDWP